jgi:hypothetical protein
MRKSSKVLAVVFLIVAGALVFYTTKQDEAAIQAAVEARIEPTLAEKKRALEETYAERQRVMEQTFADRERTQSYIEAARRQALQGHLVALDSAMTRVETPVYYRLSPEAIEQVLRRLGLGFERGQDEEENPQFEFTLATYPVVLYAGSCEEEGCDNLRIYAGFDAAPSQEKIIEWGRTKRYATAYLSEEGKACLDSDLVIKGGLTLGAVEAFITNFRDRLGEFAKHIDYSQHSL